MSTLLRGECLSFNTVLHALYFFQIVNFWLWCVALLNSLFCIACMLVLLVYSFHALLYFPFLNAGATFAVSSRLVVCPVVEMIGTLL